MSSMGAGGGRGRGETSEGFERRHVGGRDGMQGEGVCFTRTATLA